MVDDRPFSEAFTKLVKIGLTLGSRVPLKDHPGLWRHALPGGWEAAVNGHGEPIDGVPPYHARLTFNGWPAGIINPYGGIIAAGEAANEDTFIAALDEELSRLATQGGA